MTRFGLAAVLVAMAAHSASAGVCVALDESRDTLNPDDRRAAMITFGQALAKAGAQVTIDGCTATYTFYNVKFGDTITVYAIGPQGTIQARASKLDELPLVYEQLAKSLVTGAPMGTGGETVDRTNATNEQMAPRRAATDNVKLLRLGYGLISGHGTSTGPSFGAAYRYELDHLAIEISAFDMMYTSTSSNSSNSGISGSLIRLGALWYQDPLANSTLYYGGGIGYGLNHIDDGNTSLTGDGLEGHVTVGYEMLRASTIRMFVEATATLPFYESTSDDDGDPNSAVKAWVPNFVVQFGLGVGHSNTIAVVVR